MSPVDPDTISYPLSNPSLCLSVSDDPIKIATGLKASFDLFTENFLLSGDLVRENDQAKVSRFGLFTKNLIVRGSETSPRHLSLVGQPGTSKIPNGYPGGTLEVFVQNLDMDTAKKLRLDAGGGNGFSPPDGMEPHGKDGGNGGNGGQVKGLACLGLSPAEQFAEAILDKMRDGKMAWPKDFKTDVEQLMQEVSKKYVTDVHKVPASMKTAEGMLAAAKADVKHEMIRLLDDLGGIRDDLLTKLLDGCHIDGGSYGTGAQGTETRGQNGKAGDAGAAATLDTTLNDDVWKCQVCFVHPAQCRMVLDKANVQWFCGSDLQRAKAANTIEALRKRLDFVSSKAPGQGGGTMTTMEEAPLVKAYRDAEARLNIVSWASKDKEPISMTQLRAIKKEADAAMLHIRVGDNLYAWKANQVPRLSYSSYQAKAAEFLRHLAELERMYDIIWDKTKEVQVRKDAMRHRAARYEDSRATARQLMEAAKLDLEKGTEAIKIANDTIPAAKLRLSYAVQKVITEIQHAISFPWDQLISAIGQVLFMHGAATVPMVVTQEAGLLKQTIEKLESDTGVQVDRSYILKEFHSIAGTIEALDEGFHLLDDGKVDMDDPGAEKLILQEQQFDELMGHFSGYLGTTTLKEVHERFKAYVDIVQKRNQAVMNYNIDLALLVKYDAELEALKEERDDMIRTEYDNLSPDHPTMLALVKRMYQDAICNTQLWLFKQQRAYSFLALDNTNIIGDAMKDFDFSSFDATTLKNVQSEIDDRHVKFLERISLPPQTYHEFSYKLERDDICFIQVGGKRGVILSVRIPTSGAPGEPDPFQGMADIRLLRVRFFAKGATTATRRLAVFLTHSGDEIIMDKTMKQFKYSHDPLTVLFKYNLDDGKYTGPDTTDGVIGSVGDATDKYALVGPYTTWKIVIDPKSNEGLDLSRVKEAHLGFDFQYRAVSNRKT